MLLVMWAVAPVGWCRMHYGTPTDLPPGTRNDRYEIIICVRRPRTCSLPRHTIHERIE